MWVLAILAGVEGWLGRLGPTVHITSLTQGPFLAPAKNPGPYPVPVQVWAQ